MYVSHLGVEVGWGLGEREMENHDLGNGITNVISLFTTATFIPEDFLKVYIVIIQTLVPNKL